MSRFEDAVTSPDAIASLPMRAMCAADLEERKPYECFFCRESFAELPFFGCCAHCYTSKPDVRECVDDSTPQTITVAL